MFCTLTAMCRVGRLWRCLRSSRSTTRAAENYHSQINCFSSSSSFRNRNEQIWQSSISKSFKDNIRFLPSTSASFSSSLSLSPSERKFLSKQKSSSASKHGKTLVILCGWLGAKEKHLDKYVRLYHFRRIDVIRVATRWIDITCPTATIEPNAAALSYALREISSLYDHIIFHTLSSGAYFYASMIESMCHQQNHHHHNNRSLSPQDNEVINEEEEEEKEYSENNNASSPLLSSEGIAPGQNSINIPVKGVIHDCLVDWLYVLRNKKALDVILDPALHIFPHEKLAEQLLEHRQTCPPFLRIGPRKLHFFERMNAIVRENPLRLPGLLLFSAIDPLSDPAANYRLAERWLRNGIEVVSQCWSDTPHVQMFRRHPREYIELVDAFLDRIERGSDSGDSGGGAGDRARDDLDRENLQRNLWA